MISSQTESTRRFLHNGDFSGEVIINLWDKGEVTSTPDMSGRTQYQVTLPTQDLLDIVAAYVRRTKIAELQRMSSHELLGLPGQDRDEP